MKIMSENGGIWLCGLTAENATRWNSHLHSSRVCQPLLITVHPSVKPLKPALHSFVMKHYYYNRKWCIWKILTNTHEGVWSFAWKWIMSPKRCLGNICFRPLSGEICGRSPRKCLPYSLDLTDGIWTGRKEKWCWNHILLKQNKNYVLTLFWKAFFRAWKIPWISCLFFNNSPSFLG